MTAILLALGAALAYGASDFIGGRASTRAHFSLVTTVGAGAALVIAALAAPLIGGDLAPTPMAWGVASGLGSGLGTLFLYRGLARARVAVVAPTSGVLAAALPAGLAVVLGERPAPVTVLGLVLALPAVWLISGGGGETQDDGRPTGLIDGVLAGVGFGTLFLALDQAGDSAGLWPLAVGQATAFVLVALIAFRSRGAAPEVESPATGQTWWPLAVATGVLGSAATLLFYASTTTGLLTIAAVLTSLYPAGTILLARLVLDERISRRQGLGLALAGCAVVLITVG
ncbi:MAG: DMT family transporter [Actinomycetota bacterium]|nr:DMT family transporter [Actinomycetota bacterium]